jgi:hypothetical protein
MKQRKQDEKLRQGAFEGVREKGADSEANIQGGESCKMMRKFD